MTTRNTTFCPSGTRHKDYCYCTTSMKQKFPQYCDVECEMFHPRGPDDSGCQCPDFYGGARCERYLCHYAPSIYYDKRYYQLFCLDNFDMINTTAVFHKNTRVEENCTDVELHDRPPMYFPQCPCLNGGRREAIEAGDLNCVCPKGYGGALCQIAPPNFTRPSPGPTLGVIAFLAAVFVVIGLALWYRKRQHMKLYAKMYQLDPIATNKRTGTTRTIFAPLKLPRRATTAGDDVENINIDRGAAGPSSTVVGPGGIMAKNRRGTLSALFAGRHNAQRQPGAKRKKTQAKNMPTVFDGTEDQPGSGQQQPTASYDDQFGNQPQNFSSGMGMS